MGKILLLAALVLAGATASGAAIPPVKAASPATAPIPPIPYPPALILISSSLVALTRF